jgi:hypothetical protein
MVELHLMEIPTLLVEEGLMELLPTLVVGVELLEPEVMGTMDLQLLVELQSHLMVERVEMAILIILVLAFLVNSTVVVDLVVQGMVMVEMVIMDI